MNQLLLTNGSVVNEGRIAEADLLITGDRIERIGQGAIPAGTEVIDLKGQYVLPGIIDDQVHFREPGMTHKAGIASESRAAIAGGVTSYLDMPNNVPPCISRSGLAAKKAIAAGSSFANYGFYLGATNTNIDEVKAATVADAWGSRCSWAHQRVTCWSTTRSRWRRFSRRPHYRLRPTASIHR